jgi:uncharacterized protein
MTKPSSLLTITKSQARRFLIHQYALDSFQPFASVQEAIERLEFVQEDSINVCGRMHDLILWHRVKNYTPKMLHDALYGASATAFEYYIPNLSAIPLTEYAYFAPRMHARTLRQGRWEGLLDDEKPIAAKLLEKIDAEGAVRTRSLGNEDGHMQSGWGTKSTVISQVTEKLWLQGVLSIAKRENFERHFDRTARVYPSIAHLHTSSASLPDATEREAFFARKYLKTRRLVSAGKKYPGVATQKVQIEGVKRVYQCLAEDVEVLQNAPEVPDTLQILAPLEPLIYDRTRSEDLWDFHYRWEVYTPETKRVRGYYALPLLWGESIVGWMNPKLDKKTGVLSILSQDVASDVPQKYLTQRLEEYAAFLGAKEIVTKGKN